MIVAISIEMFNLNILCLINKDNLLLLILKELEDILILKDILFKFVILFIPAVLLQVIIKLEVNLNQEKMTYNQLVIYHCCYFKCRYHGVGWVKSR
jgi:hypothetical protein